jgi:hypothetical protein
VLVAIFYRLESISKLFLRYSAIASGVIASGAKQSKEIQKPLSDVSLRWRFRSKVSFIVVRKRKNFAGLLRFARNDADQNLKVALYHDGFEMGSRIASVLR